MGTAAEVPVVPTDSHIPPSANPPASPPAGLDDQAVDARLRAAAARRALDVVSPHADDRDLLALCAGQLPEARAEVVERHLARCGECRELLAQLSRPVSPDLTASVERAFPAAPAAAPRPVRRWALPVGLGVLAAAAAVVVSLGIRPGQTGGQNDHPDFDWVAGYSAERVEGGAQQIRSEDLPESVDFAPGSKIRWVLRARDAAPTPVVSAFVGPVGGTLRPVEVKVERGPDGTVLVAGDAAAILGPAPGAKVLAVVLGPAPVSLAGRSTGDLASAVPASAGVLFTKTLRFGVEGSP